MIFSRRLLPLYIGGLMGPFGTVIILPMFPELRETYGVSSEAVGWAFTAYLIPFAFLLLVSGTLGERWGRRRTVRLTYILYTVASLLCALAPTFEWFIAGRVLQGISNAFITPLLIAGLAEIVPTDRFGRALGAYSSFQALGSATAPAIGGIAADLDWRWALVGTAIVSGLLALVPPQGEPKTQQTGAAAPQWPAIKPLLTKPMLILGFGAMAGAAGPLGISILVAVAARDELGLSGTRAGLLLIAGPLAAMACGPIWGRLADRLGLRVTGVLASIAATVLALTLAIALRPIPLTIIWAATGAVLALAVVALQGIGATVVPDNRGGALSFLLAFRFLGHALGPIIWLPVFAVSVRGSIIGASLLGVLLLAAFVFGPDPKLSTSTTE